MFRHQGDVVLMQKKAIIEQACLKLLVLFLYASALYRENSSRDCPQQKTAAANLNGQEASLKEGQHRFTPSPPLLAS